MHRFFIPATWLHGNTVRIEDAPAHQIRNVLRMRPGARLVVLDNTGWEYEIELVEVDKAHVQGLIHHQRAVQTEPAVAITLYQCLLKKDNFEWVLQKCSEVGVSRFVPVTSQRTIVTFPKASKFDRWQRIVTEAAEQSGRGRVPELAEPLTFEQAVAAQNAQPVTESGSLALIPWEAAAERRLHDVCCRAPEAQSIALFIGPEGGFDPGEIEMAEAAGVLPVTLGPRILRAETAAVVACALVLHETERR